MSNSASASRFLQNRGRGDQRRPSHIRSDYTGSKIASTEDVELYKCIANLLSVEDSLTLASASTSDKQRKDILTTMAFAPQSANIDWRPYGGHLGIPSVPLDYRSDSIQNDIALADALAAEAHKQLQNLDYRSDPIQNDIALADDLAAEAQKQLQKRNTSHRTIRHILDDLDKHAPASPEKKKVRFADPDADPDPNSNPNRIDDLLDQISATRARNEAETIAEKQKPEYLAETTGANETVDPTTRSPLPGHDSNEEEDLDLLVDDDGKEFSDIEDEPIPVLPSRVRPRLPTPSQRASTAVKNAARNTGRKSLVFAGSVAKFSGRAIRLLRPIVLSTAANFIISAYIPQMGGLSTLITSTLASFAAGSIIDSLVRNGDRRKEALAAQKAGMNMTPKQLRLFGPSLAVTPVGSGVKTNRGTPGSSPKAASNEAAMRQAVGNASGTAMAWNAMRTLGMPLLGPVATATWRYATGQGIIAASKAILPSKVAGILAVSWVADKIGWGSVGGKVGAMIDAFLKKHNRLQQRVSPRRVRMWIAKYWTGERIDPKTGLPVNNRELEWYEKTFAALVSSLTVGVVTALTQYVNHKIPQSLADANYTEMGGFVVASSNKAWNVVSGVTAQTHDAMRHFSSGGSQNLQQPALYDRALHGTFTAEATPRLNAAQSSAFTPTPANPVLQFHTHQTPTLQTLDLDSSLEELPAYTTVTSWQIMGVIKNLVGFRTVVVEELAAMQRSALPAHPTTAEGLSEMFSLPKSGLVQGADSVAEQWKADLQGTFLGILHDEKSMASLAHRIAIESPAHTPISASNPEIVSPVPVVGQQTEAHGLLYAEQALEQPAASHLTQMFAPQAPYVAGSQPISALTPDLQSVHHEQWRELFASGILNDVQFLESLANKIDSNTLRMLDDLTKNLVVSSASQLVAGPIGKIFGENPEFIYRMAQRIDPDNIIDSFSSAAVNAGKEMLLNAPTVPTREVWEALMRSQNLAASQAWQIAKEANSFAQLYNVGRAGAIVTANLAEKIYGVEKVGGVSKLLDSVMPQTLFAPLERMMDFITRHDGGPQLVDPTAEFRLINVNRLVIETAAKWSLLRPAMQFVNAADAPTRNTLIAETIDVLLLGNNIHVSQQSELRHNWTRFLGRILDAVAPVQRGAGTSESLAAVARTIREGNFGVQNVPPVPTIPV